MNYPNKKQNHSRKIVSSANRGMNFENMINQTNDFYLNDDIAVIHKKPIPIQIVKVDYQKRSAAKIIEAYYKLPSTTDYNGIYKGRYIDFEAKETKNKTSFPIKNIHEHQVKHLERCLNHGGIAFIIIYFSSLERIFFLDAKHVVKYYERSEKARKSITLKEIETYGYEIIQGYRKPVDYLKIIDIYYIEK